jgi:hypothetical protein
VTYTNIAGLVIGIAIAGGSTALLVFAVPVAELIRDLQTRMYGDRIGRMQTPAMVRLGAVLGLLLGVGMVLTATLGGFGPR